jgi:DNA-binding NarL/FixJ family response regulator
MSVSERDTRRWRLIIAGPDPARRSALGEALGREFELVGDADDGEDAIKVAAWVQPDAALLDARSPTGDGLRSVTGIARVSPETTIAILSDDASDDRTRELLGAGAIACWRGDTSPVLLARSLRDAIELWREASFAEDIEVYSEPDYLSWDAPPPRPRGPVPADW